MNKFTLDLNDVMIWNYSDFLKFLVDHQNKHIIVDTNAEGICLESIGVYDLIDKFVFASVTILTDNIVETHPRYNITLIRDRFRFLTIPTDSDYTKYHTWNKRTAFGAFYNRPTWARLGLASYLLAQLPGMSTVNFRQDPSIEDQRKYFELDKLFLVHPESVKNFAQVYDSFPRILESHTNFQVGVRPEMFTDQIAEFYPDFLIEIVAETFCTGRTFFPTEKSTKPMLLQKPYITMGPRNFLIHLRQLGFKTFHDFWDEGYDGHEGLHRYIKILDLINTLSNKSVQELESMYQQMQPALEHNYRLLIERTYTTNVTYVE
jgi:hypothetical protein